jgi:4-diphosphocytidyl-2-C-methyl-D-erythritol kinase
LPGLAELAIELGSDVPFFLRGGAALMGGRGEELDPLPPRIGQWLVLLVPPHDVLDKTRRLYSALSASDFTSGERTRRVAEAFRRGAALEEADMVNGFERAARTVFPGLSETWRDAEAVCERRFFLSGAGPTLFALAANRVEAHAAARRLGPSAYAVRTVKHARATVRYA